MRRLGVRTAPAAVRDLDEAFFYLAGEASLEIALRFDRAIETATARLAQRPGLGAPQEHRFPNLSGVRMWPVPGFRNYLIYYRVTGEALEILRVLHGARDIETILKKGL